MKLPAAELRGILLIKKLLLKHDSIAAHAFCHRCVYKYDSADYHNIQTINGALIGEISHFINFTLLKSVPWLKND